MLNVKDGGTLPHDLRAEVGAVMDNNRDYFQTIVCVDAQGRLLFRAAERTGGGSSSNSEATADDEAVEFQTKDFVMSSVRVDGRVWSVTAPATLRSGITHEPYGAGMRLTAPLFVEGEALPRGALIAEMKLEPLFDDAGRSYAAPDATQNGAARASVASRLVVALDRTGYIIYHTSDAYKHQTVAGQMPFFQPIADKMAAGAGGSDFYERKEGERWLAAYRPVAAGEISVAVARNYTATVAAARGTGLSGIWISALAALATTVLLALIARRAARRIERVTAGAAAIAGGDLDQRIEVRTSDETRVLAESFNVMSDRLREHIAREAETRQFEAFMRLSAMLTHDLKNSITGLSILVENCEKHFHREEFRADAIFSLREATDKLRRIVARLSEPVKSLSGEYRRNTKSIDLIPIIRRVLAVTAEPSAPLYEIKTNLPESLVALAEAERIENVIENLVINAMEAMSARGGRLTIEAGTAEAGRVFFSVADTGVGMSEDFLRLRLFRAFATTKSKGIGLGLYTCREIVEAHGGRIDVESQLGVGTRFRVVLPSVPFASSRDSHHGGKEQAQDRTTTAATDSRLSV